MFNLEKYADPQYEAVSVDEIKAHCRVAVPNDDEYFADLVVAAREQVEKDLQQAVVGQQYKLYLDHWLHYWNVWPLLFQGVHPWHYNVCYPHIPIPIQPVLSVESITYTDTDGDVQTLDTSLYEFKSYKDPPHIRLVDSGGLPDIQPYSVIVVSFTAGYADAAPKLIKHAIYFLAAHWYEHREALVETLMRDVPLGYERIINRLRVKRFK